MHPSDVPCFDGVETDGRSPSCNEIVGLYRVGPNLVDDDPAVTKPELPRVPESGARDGVGRNVFEDDVRAAATVGHVGVPLYGGRVDLLNYLIGRRKTCPSD
jgi:hypothetical protein